jgi:hypothetical protein
VHNGDIPQLMCARCFIGAKVVSHPAVGDHRMPEYRAYIVGRDGHFTGFEPLLCGDDAHAIEKAKRLVDDHDVELWSGERLVTRLSATKQRGDATQLPTT